MYKSILIVMTLLLHACTAAADNEIGRDYINEDNVEKIALKAKVLRDKGHGAIPIFEKAIRHSVKNPYSVIEGARLYISTKSLYKLAKENIYTVNEVGSLIAALRSQIISNSFETAETLRLITGIDTGWDKKFIKNYKVEDENILEAKIKQWEDWLKENVKK